MSTRVPAELLKQGKEVRVAELPVVRRGVFRAGEGSASSLAATAPGQWVVMALIPSCLARREHSS